jgi:hypothetical protein
MRMTAEELADAIARHMSMHPGPAKNFLRHEIEAAAKEHPPILAPPDHGPTLKEFYDWKFPPRNGPVFPGWEPSGAEESGDA